MHAAAQECTHLFLEPQSLLEGIVQLGVCVAELLSAHKPFEALAEAWAGSMPLGEGGHNLRVTDWWVGWIISLDREVERNSKYQ